MAADKVQKLLAELDKQFGKGTVALAKDAKSIQITRIPTGSFAFDCMLAGGIPENRITLLAGPYSAGKTTLALKVVANAQRIFKERAEMTNTSEKVVFWNDVEGVFDDSWARACGVDLDTLIVGKPEYGEQALDIADAVVRSGTCGLLVIDSIAALIPKKEMDDSMDDSGVGLAARMVNKFLRKLVSGMQPRSLLDDLAAKNEVGTTVLLINQLREKVGVMFGSPEVLPGGRGQEFVASIILDIRRGEWLNAKWRDELGVDRSEAVGHVMKCTVRKNKTAPPRTSAEARFYFKDSPAGKAGTFDDMEAIAQQGDYYGVIRRAGAYYYVAGADGVEQSFQGMGALSEHFRTHPEAAETVKSQVLSVIQKQ